MRTESHATADVIVDVAGRQLRYCQQCARLEALELFEGKRRSCRASLRRRRGRTVFYNDKEALVEGCVEGSGSEPGRSSTSGGGGGSPEEKTSSGGGDSSLALEVGPPRKRRSRTGAASFSVAGIYVAVGSSGATASSGIAGSSGDPVPAAGSSGRPFVVDTERQQPSPGILPPGLFVPVPLLQQQLQYRPFSPKQVQLATGSTLLDGASQPSSVVGLNALDLEQLLAIDAGVCACEKTGI